MGRNSIGMPDQLGIQFGALAGIYLAALIAPALTIFAVEYLNLHNGVLAFSVLGILSITVGSLVMYLANGKEKIASWLNTGWTPWFLPLIGLIPVVAYQFSVIEVFVAFYIDPAAISVSSLLGSVGFLLGIVAAWVGEIAIRTARNKVASAATSPEEISVKWTAKWPRTHRIKVQIFVTLTGIVLAGLLAVWYSPQLTVSTFPYGLIVLFSLTLVIITHNLVAERVYTLTPGGLEHRRSGRLFTARQFLPWSQIDSFTVSDEAVILHRSKSLPDLRFARYDIRPGEEQIIANLEEYLERKA